MNAETPPIEDKIAQIIRGFRRFGRVFVALTILMGAFSVFQAFDPSAPFRYNGVEVHTLSRRLLCVLPLCFLTLFGSFFAFAPRSIMERFLRYQFGEMQKMKQRWGWGK